MPSTVGSKVFCFFYQAFGIINLAVAIGTAQDTLYETWQAAYRRRRILLQRKHRERRAARDELLRKQREIEEQLEGLGVPVWVPVGGSKADGGHASRGSRGGIGSQAEPQDDPQPPSTRGLWLLPFVLFLRCL